MRRQSFFPTLLLVGPGGASNNAAAAPSRPPSRTGSPTLQFARPDTLIRLRRPARRHRRTAVRGRKRRETYPAPGRRRRRPPRRTRLPGDPAPRRPTATSPTGGSGARFHNGPHVEVSTRRAAPGGKVQGRHVPERPPGQHAAPGQRSQQYLRYEGRGSKAISSAGSTSTGATGSALRQRRPRWRCRALGWMATRLPPDGRLGGTS
jgi:hypothetical protein